MTPNLFNTLKQRFSRNRIALPFDSVLPDSLPNGRNDIVLSRGWCVFRRFDFEHVPSRRRAQALMLELQRWSPFQATAHSAVWQGGHALVWCWDGARVAPENRPDANIGQWWPESLLRSVPSADGTYLRAAIDGFLGQVWRDGRLMGEYWWADQPDALAWQRFCRANGVLVALPEAVDPLQFEDRPFASQSAFQLDVRGLETGVVTTAFVAIAALVAFYYGAAARLAWETADIETREQVLVAEAEPILAARARAVNANVESERLLKLLDAPSVQVLLEKTAERMPTAAKLRDWRFNLDRLEFTLEGNGLTALDVVQAYQSVDAFADVQAAPGNRPDRLVVSLRVK